MASELVFVIADTSTTRWILGKQEGNWVALEGELAFILRRTLQLVAQQTERMNATLVLVLSLSLSLFS